MTFSATGLPTGLNIDPTTGTISGTPQTGGSYPVTVTASDNASSTGTASFTWTVTTSVTVTSPGDQSDVSGSGITPLSVSAGDSSVPATLTYAASGLPTGLLIDSGTGVISGVPTTAGSYSPSITVTDEFGGSGSASFNWTVTNDVSLANPGDQTDQSGSAITALASDTTDSSSTATFSYTGGGTLPPGLSIDPSSGAVSGSPTTAGTFPVTLTVTDSGGFSSSAVFNWTITNVVTVANPGDQSSPSGTAITDLLVERDRFVLGRLDRLVVGDRTSSGPEHRLVVRDDLGHAEHRRHLSGHPHCDRRRRILGFGVLHVAVDQHRDGDRSRRPIRCVRHPRQLVHRVRRRLVDHGDGELLRRWDSPTGSVRRSDLRSGEWDTDHSRNLRGHHHGHGRFRFDGVGVVHVDRHQHGDGDEPRDQTSGSGAAITPLASQASDSSDTATISSWSATGLPVGLTINPTTGAVSGTPTTGGSGSVTVTATDSAGYTGSATFQWSVTNTVSVTDHRVIRRRTSARPSPPCTSRPLIRRIPPPSPSAPPAYQVVCRSLRRPAPSPARRPTPAPSA